MRTRDRSEQHDQIARTVLRRFFEIDASISPLVLVFDELESADDDTLALVHDRAYIEVVRETCERGGGWFDADTYLNERSYAAAVRAVGGVLSAVEAVRDGKDVTALCLVRPPEHHATPDRGMGFCLFQ
jgi:acetoin utilization deacetylase AcuC-like enzyme